MSSHSIGATQCPHCGRVINAPITMKNGGQVITCQVCRKNFTAEVQQGSFTGRNR